MEQSFRTRSDWFEVGIRPALLRRTVIGAVIIALCLAWWLQTRGWIPLVVIGLVVFERAFEFMSVRSTKELLASSEVTVSDRGLFLSGAKLEQGVLYPWSTLRASLARAKDGSVTKITVVDIAQKGSKISLIGYEDMDELGTLIENNAIES